MTLVGVALAAAAGAVIRFRLSPHGWRATLLVNLVGSFVLGLLLAWRPGSDTAIVLGTGFCGSLTTYGTFALEASTGPTHRRLLVIAANLAGCVGAAWLGWTLA
jgi:CrcB protein